MSTDAEKRNQAECVNEILALNKNKDTISTIKWQDVDWLTEFIQINMNELRKTILRSMSEKGLGSLEGYTEGYFNEAIQNVNDLNCADEICIDVNKNGNKYTIVFEYADNEGFSISNICFFKP